MKNKNTMLFLSLLSILLFTILLAGRMAARTDKIPRSPAPARETGKAASRAGERRFVKPNNGDWPRLRDKKISEVYSNQNQITALAADDEYLWIGSRGGLRRIPLQVEIPAGHDPVSDDNLADLSLVAELPSPEVRDLAWAGDYLVLLTANGPARIRTKDHDLVSVERITVPEEFVPARGTCLLSDHERVLIGTDHHGLFSLSGSTVTALAAADELLNVRITDLAVIDRVIFAATLGQGVFKLDGNRIVRLQSDQGLPDDWVTDLLVDNGNLWIVTTSGLALYRQNRIQRIGVDDKNVTTLALCDVSGTEAKPGDHAVCAGTEGNGLAEFHDTRGQKILRRDLPTINTILSAGERLWVGTDDGLFMRSKSGWREIRSAGPGSNNVTSMAVWRGRIWVGTFDAGLSSYDGLSWTYYTDKNGLGSDTINALTPARDGLYIATMNGLSIASSGQAGISFRNITAHDGLGSNHVMAVAVWNNRIAVATAAGVSILDRDQITSYGPAQGLAGKSVYALAASGPYLWAGTIHGLSRFDGRTWTNFTAERGELPDNWITALADLHGDLWIGTYDAGLLRLHRGERRFYIPQQDLPCGWISPGAMLAENGALWIGSAGCGLFNYQERTIQYLAGNDGLLSDEVTSLARYQGNIWVGTRSGIAVLSNNFSLSEGLPTGQEIN